MKKSIYYFVLFLPVFVLSSCMSLQSKSYVILNPDMSGKCTYEIKMGRDMAGIMTMPKEDMNSGFGAGASAKSSKKGNQDAALALASKLLSSGTIDTWKDVQFGYIKKDTVFFRGTAYFKDITKMSVSMLDSAVKVYKNSDGNMVLEMNYMKNKKDTAITWTNHAYDSVYASIYQNIGLSDLMHFYYASMVKGLDVRSTYELPGKIISSSNFVRKNDRTVSIALTGDDVIKLLDTMASSEGMINNMYGKYFSGMGMGGNQGGYGTNDDPYAYNKILYGEDKPVQVVFKSDGKPAFDYAKEVADAKKQYMQFRRKSGIEQYDSLQAIAAKEAEEEKQKEEGTLVITAADSANGKMYLKSLKAKQYGDYMSFSGTLSKPLKENYGIKVKITKAVSDKGLNITDSLNKRSSSYFDAYDSGAKDNTISAYLSSSNYSYGSYSDTNALYDMVSFNVYANLPADANYINLEGEIIVDSEHTITFKIIKLYPKKTDDYNFGKWK